MSKKRTESVRSTPLPKVPQALDEFVDKVLRFKPAPRSKAAKKRAELKVVETERKRAAD